MSNIKRVIIIGGGIAGLASARTLACSGTLKPLVLESETILGGKAASWRQGDSLIEVGLHVCFPYYRHLLDLLAELGTSGSIAWGEPALSYVRADGDVARLQFPCLPPPLHAAVALARHRHLTKADRLSSILGAIEATLSRSGWRNRFESVSFAQWAKRRGMSKGLLENVFEPLIRGLTFLRADQVSGRAMLDYIHAVSNRPDICRIGSFRAGSSEVVIEPLARDITRRGGEIRRNSRVAGLIMSRGRAAGVRLMDGTELHSDVTISAVPCHEIKSIMPDAVRDNLGIRNATRLQSVAVASVIIWFDRRVGGPASVRLSPGCVFNTWVDMTDVMPEFAGLNRSILQLVVAPLGELAGMDDAALSARVVADIRKVLPAARSAHVQKAVVTRTDKAFHAMVPGAQSLRPEVDVGIPGLLLAGDHVGAGRNPNMETAVISGQQAAHAALALVA